MIPDRELPTRGPHKVDWDALDKPYEGPGREGLRVMAFNALSQADRKRYLRRGEMDQYLDETADHVERQAQIFQDRTLGFTYDAEQAWKYAIRLVVHGQEPD